MKMYIETLDLKKYDDEIDETLRKMVIDVIETCKNSFPDESDAFLINMTRYVLLKASVILSQAMERKTMNLIEECDKNTCMSANDV